MLSDSFRTIFHLFIICFLIARWNSPAIIMRQGDSISHGSFHVEIYALIGFIIFFTFFILVSINAFRMKKEEVDEISNMPLDNQETQGVVSDQSQ